MSRRFARQEGFGMVEVIVAMALLGIAALMALPMLYYALEHSRFNTMAAEASQVMNSEISQVSAREHTCTDVLQWGSETPEPVPSSHTDWDLIILRETHCRDDGTARVEVRVTSHPGDRHLGDVSTVVRISDEDDD
ncbi:type II secretion system protein [Nesterenkonia populi]